MEKEEILNKSKKKCVVGEMENQKINKGNWIALIFAGVVALALMITEGALGNFQGLFAIGAVCYAWASVIYFCQFFVAKRPWPVLIGAILHGLAMVTMIVLYAISYIQGW